MLDLCRCEQVITKSLATDRGAESCDTLIWFIQVSLGGHRMHYITETCPKLEARCACTACASLSAGLLRYLLISIATRDPTMSHKLLEMLAASLILPGVSP